MKTIENFMHKITLRTVVISIIVFLAAFMLINGSLIGTAKLMQVTGGVGNLDVEFGYTVDEAYDLFERLGPEGRSFNLRYIIPMDILFPLTLAFFFVCIIAYLLERINSSTRRCTLFILPVAGVFFDWIENICITIMLLHYPDRLPIVCKLGSMATMLKFFIVIVNILLITVLLAVLVIRVIRRKCV